MSLTLYDRPGPRTKRRILLGSIVAVLGIAVVVYFVIQRLADQGQLTYEKWGPLFDPSHEQFTLLWKFLGGGLVNTIKAASLAVIFSLIAGTALAVTRVTANRSYRWLVVATIELLRGVPVVMTIYFTYRVLPELGLELSLLWFLVIGLTLYNAVVIAEIVRAGILSLPRGQTEAAYAIGLTRWQTLRLVLLPQAFRAMLPALISQLVVVLKDTSLGFIIQFEEFLRRGQLAIQTTRNPLQLYLIIGAVFVIVNYLLSRLAIYVERRLSHARTTPVATEEAALAAEHAGTAGGA